MLEGPDEVEHDGERLPTGKGEAALVRPDLIHRFFNIGEETVRLLVVAGIMLVPLLPSWPRPSHYVIHKGPSANIVSSYIPSLKG